MTLSLEDMAAILIQKDWLESRFGFTQMHHPVYVLTVQSLTLLCLRACADKPRCLPLYLFHNHFFSLMVLWPMLHLPYNISSCLSSDCACWLLGCLSSVSFASCWKTPVALTVKSLDFDTVSFILHLSFTDFKFSISLDRFISPASTKPHYEGFNFWICCLAFKAVLYNLPELFCWASAVKKSKCLTVTI